MSIKHEHLVFVGCSKVMGFFILFYCLKIKRDALTTCMLWPVWCTVQALSCLSLVQSISKHASVVYANVLEFRYLHVFDELADLTHNTSRCHRTTWKRRFIRGCCKCL